MKETLKSEQGMIAPLTLRLTMLSVLSFLRLWLNKRQYYFHKDELLRQELMEWTEGFDDKDLPPTTVLGFRLFVKTLVHHFCSQL